MLFSFQQRGNNKYWVSSECSINIGSRTLNLINKSIYLKCDYHDLQASWISNWWTTSTINIIQQNHTKREIDINGRRVNDSNSTYIITKLVQHYTINQDLHINIITISISIYIHSIISTISSWLTYIQPIIIASLLLSIDRNSIVL